MGGRRHRRRIVVVGHHGATVLDLACVFARLSAADRVVLVVVVAEDDGGGDADVAPRAAAGRRGRPRAVTGAFVPAGPGAVATVDGHVRSHLDGDLAVRRLAEVAGVSPRHLARIFASQLGTSPARYVRRVRLEAAAELLVTSALPVARVAARCGFGSAEALRQAFVRCYGTTPSHYRSAGHAA